MTINEKAKKYAENKALEAMSAAIEQAFVEGYNQGYTEGREDEKNSCAATMSLDDYDLVTFVELGLPSGTKWSSNYLMKEGNACYFTYDEAAKLNIPTLEQLEELVSFCERFSIKSGLQFVGLNGNNITVENADYRKDSERTAVGNSSCPKFWLNDQSQDILEIEKNCAWFYDKKSRNTLFKGYRIPVMLVSK